MPRFTRFLLAAMVGLALQFVAIGSVSGQQHVVSAGDSLGFIAELYGVTVGSIVGANDIVDPNVIFPGQSLQIPGAGGSSAYEVEPGDTLGGIAAKFGVSVSELQSANGITDPNYVYVGQVLTVPAGGSGGGGQSGSGAHSSGLSLADKPYDAQIEGLMEEFAAYEGLDPGMVKAVAWIESGWQQHVVSYTGAVGVMQLMPGTAGWLEDEVFGYELNERESMYDNIKAGVRYLRILMDATGWDARLAIGSYYQGHGTTLNGIIYDDTVDYVGAVMAVWGAYWP